jgi:hypothetical protein
VQDALTESAAGRRRIDRRAPLVAVLTLIAGAVLGAIIFQFEQARATWRPKVTRTATGWSIRSAYGHGPQEMALAAKHIVWVDSDNVITMDLSSGKTKLLGVRAKHSRPTNPAVSDQYTAWMIGDPGAQGHNATVYVYDFGTGRRLQATGFAFDSGLAIAGTTMVWESIVSGSTNVTEIRGENLSSGAQFVLAGARGNTLRWWLSPTIAGDLVGWTAKSVDPQIDISDLSTQEMWTIVPFKATAGIRFVRWTLSGRTVVWMQTAAFSGSTIIAENLNTRVRRVVATLPVGTAPAFAIDGDLVVWVQAVAGRPTELVDRGVVQHSHGEGIAQRQLRLSEGAEKRHWSLHPSLLRGLQPVRVDEGKDPPGDPQATLC